MPNASLMQTSFNGGEFSPLMEGHIDSPKRGSAVKELQNLLCLKQGPAARRGGTKYVARVKDSSKSTRLVEFEYSTAQAYILEVGENYIRFFRNNGSIFSASQSITNISSADPAVLTYSGADNFANGDEIFIENVAGMTEVNGKRFLVANVNVGLNTFELQDLDGNDVDSTGYTAYSSGGDVSYVYEVTTTYAEEDLFDLRFTQSADVLYITHPDYAPRSLVRNDHNDWTLNELTLNDGPYLEVNIGTTTLTPSGGSYAPGDTPTVTASAITGINGDTGFQATDVGRIIRIKNGSDWAWGEITARSSTTVVTVEVKGTIDFPSSATTDWRLGAWSDTTGYPACCNFFQDRFVAAGGPDTPLVNTIIQQRICFTETGGYSDTELFFAPTSQSGAVVSDDNAITIVLNSRKVNNVRWLSGNEKGLQVGTSGAEWIIKPSINSVTLTPSDADAYRVGTNGSSNIEPVVVNWATLFPQKANKKLLQLAYSFESDTYKAPDLTILAEHITRTGMVELAYQQEPQNIVWACLANGKLIGCTYYPDENIAAWHPHVVGGFSDAAQSSSAKIESVAVIPAADGSRDELWGIVNRYIDGGTKRYVEYFTRYYEDDIDQEDAVHVDSSLSYDGSATTSISGLEHLEGQTVRVYADGANHPDKVVSGGAITLDRSASVVTVGLSNKWIMELLRPEGGSRNGVSQGKTKRIHRLIVRLYKTLGLNYGPDADNLDEEIFDYFTKIGTAPSLFTGDKELDFDGDYELAGNVRFEDDGPFPAQIQAVMYQLVVEDAI